MARLRASLSWCGRSHSASSTTYGLTTLRGWRTSAPAFPGNPTPQCPAFSSVSTIVIRTSRSSGRWIWFPELEAAIAGEVTCRLAKAEADGISFADRGAVWTYLTTDQPFGVWTERLLKGIHKKLWGSGT
jgi:hypothetical protein